MQRNSKVRQSHPSLTLPCRR